MLQTADRAAGAFLAVGDERDMSEFRSPAGISGEEFPAYDHGTSDPCTYSDENDI